MCAVFRWGPAVVERAPRRTPAQYSAQACPRSRGETGGVSAGPATLPISGRQPNAERRPPGSSKQPTRPCRPCILPPTAQINWAAPISAVPSWPRIGWLAPGRRDTVACGTAYPSGETESGADWTAGRAMRCSISFRCDLRRSLPFQFSQTLLVHSSPTVGVARFGTS